jgi:CelD/BcsL family acetyltransferase involved in cellulose biosynthesis
MYTVRRLNTDGFRQARDEWNSLASEMAFPSIFCTWEWIYTWWEHFGGAYDPVILAVYDGPALKGIMPLALQKADTVKSQLKGRVLSYCGSKEVYPDHLDVISSREDAPECMRAVWDYLADEFTAWDVIEIALMSEGSNLLSYINSGQLRYEADVKQRSKAPFIPLEGGLEEYMQSFGSKQRYSIRSRQRKLYEQLGAWYAAGSPSESTIDLKTLFSLHAMRAKRKNIVSTFQGEELFNFHDALIRRLNAQGRAWLRLIRNSTGIIAAFYGFSFGGHLFYYQIGLDTELERYAPGKVLMFEVIKEAFDSGHKEFDFLRGDEEYKSYWTRASRDLFAVSIYNGTVMATITKTVSQSKDLIKRHVKRFIR